MAAAARARWLWKGHRLLAADGVRFLLPSTQPIIDEWGRPKVASGEAYQPQLLQVAICQVAKGKSENVGDGYLRGKAGTPAESADSAGLRRQAPDNKKPTAFAVGFSWLTKRDECTTVLRL